MRTAGPLLLVALASVCLAQGPAGLIAHWPFEDETADHALDATGRGHDLSLQGVQRVPGAIGQALRFSGAGSLVQAPIPEDLQSPAEVTLEAWVRPDAIPPGSEGLGILNLGNVLLRLTRDTPSFHVFTDRWGPILADGAVRLGQWYHVVGTYDRREMRIYVNGELAGSRERLGDIPRCERPLQLGRQANPFVGLIDEAKVHTRRLSREEVSSAFAAAVRRLNPGVAPRTLKYADESWMSTTWRTAEPPPALADWLGPPLTARPEPAGDALCALCVDIPKAPVRASGAPLSVADLPWRFAESLGCSRLQLWPPAGPSEDWEAQARLLTAGRARGVKLAVPLPLHPKAMRAVWARLAPHGGVIDAVLVCNGIPTNPWEPLASWRFTGTPEEWVAACVLARSLVPAGTRVLLARVPLRGPGGPARIEEVSRALAGQADGLCVAVHGIDDPEAIVAGPLREAAAVARRHGLEVWLDAAADRTQPGPLRTALLLRLLVLCQMQGIRLTWWPDTMTPSGPTATADLSTALWPALQAWNRAVEPPAEPVDLPTGDTRVLRWHDRAGRTCVAWWQADGAVQTIGDIDLELPPGAMVADPLHACWLTPRPATRLPLCRWPLVARGGGR